MDMAIVADSLASYVTHLSAVMLLTMYDNWIIVYYYEGFQQYLPSQCGEMIENVIS